MCDIDLSFFTLSFLPHFVNIPSVLVTFLALWSNTLTKSNLGEERSFLAYTSKSQSTTEGRQDSSMDLKAAQLAIPWSVTANQGASITAKELQQEPWRLLLASWLLGWLILS